MVSATEEYYIIRLDNILTYMENNDYYNNKYKKKVIDVRNNILHKGLTNKNIKEMKDINSYFIEEVYPSKKEDSSEGLNNIWSNYKNGVR